MHPSEDASSGRLSEEVTFKLQCWVAMLHDNAEVPFLQTLLLHLAVSSLANLQITKASSVLS